jgi:hypothetical protein
MTAALSKFLLRSAFGFAGFCKKGYLAKVDRSV